MAKDLPQPMHHHPPSQHGGSDRTHDRRHYAYVDCTRGYAVLMVIACHLAYEFPGLPYIVKRIVTSGWFGVQLFFLASCLTLLMSWHAETDKAGSVDVPAFFLRRFFRIAPAYYAAGLLYFWLIPPSGGFDFWHASLSAGFINAWHPVWTPTVKGGWVVVPGGWSISVEFTFYAIFPLFALYVTSLRRALAVFAACVAMGVSANLAAAVTLSPSYDAPAVSNFLFFWFPNQASVFALGGVLFFVLRGIGTYSRLLAHRSTVLAAVAVSAFCMTTFLPFGHYLGDWPPVPAGLAVCLPLMGFILALSGGSRIFVNAAMVAMGRVSFSAYLLHFAVLRLFGIFPVGLRTQAVSVMAIIAYGCGFALTVVITYVGAWLSYRLIEQPMIGVGKQLIRQSQRRFGTS